MANLAECSKSLTSGEQPLLEDCSLARVASSAASTSSISIARTLKRRITPCLRKSCKEAYMAEKGVWPLWQVRRASRGEYRTARSHPSPPSSSLCINSSSRSRTSFKLSVSEIVMSTWKYWVARVWNAETEVCMATSPSQSKTTSSHNVRQSSSRWEVSCEIAHDRLRGDRIHSSGALIEK
eukprot:scaffold5636_cov159-Ochromonas_danica.AAC.26